VTDFKKKKPIKKQKNTLHKFGNISVFDGIRVKGELELYFKAMEDRNPRQKTCKK